jgi:aspartyl protease family protein
MPVVQGPWNNRPQGPRFILWLVLLVAGAAGVWFLFQLFPGQTYTDWDWANLIWLLVILAAASTAVLSARRFKLGEVARNVGIWAGVVLVLVLGYTFQDEVGGVWRRVQAEFLPGSGVETADRILTITENSDGGFYVFADVNGTQVKFLIDTGASDVILSPDDAERVGIDVSSLSYDRGFETANGIGEGAPVKLASIAVGSIHFRDMPAYVTRADMRTSLLGMTFLRRLESFEFRGRKMLLKGR